MSSEDANEAGQTTTTDAPAGGNWKSSKSNGNTSVPLDKQETIDLNVDDNDSGNEKSPPSLPGRVTTQSVGGNSNAHSRDQSYSVGAYIKPEDYTLFEHPAHPDDAEKIEAIAREGAKTKVRTRLTREAILFSVPFTLVFLNEFFRDDGDDETDLSYTFGVAILLMTIAYFGHFFIVLTGVCDRNKKNRKYLYRIYSLNYRENSWAGMNFTWGAIIFPHHPITSISELSAVMGGTANTMLVVTSSYTFGILCCAIAVQQYNSSDDERYWSIDTFLIMLGCFGLTFVGSFELDALSTNMVRFHYLGAGLCLCAWVAFLLQSIKIANSTDWDYVTGIVFCGVMLIIMGLGFGSWEYWQRQSEKFANNENNCRGVCDEEQEKQTITSLTLKCIASEAAFLSVPAFSVAGWLLQVGKCNVHDCIAENF